MSYLIIFLLSLFISTSTFAENGLDLVPNCSGKYLSKKDVVALIPPGEASLSLGVYKVFAFKRQCHQLTGCSENWISATDKLVTGHNFGYINVSHQIEPLLSNKIHLQLKATSKNVFLEMEWDTRTYTYKYKDKYGKTITVTVSPAKGSYAVMSDGYTLFPGFHAEKHKNELHSTVGFRSLSIGEGQAGLRHRENYAHVMLEGGLYSHSCGHFSKRVHTEPDRDGLYEEYSIIVSNAVSEKEE